MRHSRKESIAETIIKQQAGPFDPTQFNDRYEDALKALIAQKTAGRVAVGAVPEPLDTNVVDLMAALRASLTRGAAPAMGKPGTSANAPAPRRAAKAAPGGAAGVVPATKGRSAPLAAGSRNWGPQPAPESQSRAEIPQLAITRAKMHEASAVTCGKL